MTFNGSVPITVTSYYSTFKLVIAVWLVLMMPICSLAQKKRTAARRSEPNRPEPAYQPNYARGPFDNHVSRLPPIYEGHDLAETYRRIARLDLKKSEFETTEEYRARVKSALGDQLYAFEATSLGLRLQQARLRQAAGLLWFRLTDWWAVPLGSPFSYEADRQVFTVRIPSVDIPTGEVCEVDSTDCITREFRGVEIHLAIKESSYYGKASKNRIAKKVTKTIVERYSVVIGGARGDLSFTLPMKADTARESKSRLSVLLICRLRLSIPDERLTFDEERQVNWPTVSDPREVVSVKKYVNMDLQKVWIYDSISGDILRKEISKKPPPFELSVDNILERGTLIAHSRLLGRIQVRTGDTIEGQWRIDSIDAAQAQATITNLRSGLEYRLSITRPQPPADELLETARSAFNAGRDEDALESLRTLLQITPQNFEAHLLMGRIYERKLDFDRAFNALKAAVFWNPKLVSAHVLIGRIAVMNNNCGAARSAAEKALQIDANDQEALALKRLIGQKCSP